MAINTKKHNPQIQSLLLKDLDKLVIKWFSEDFPLTIDGRKTPVLFASKERWAQIQKDKGIKDERGQLILPIISIRRLNPEHRKERSYPNSPETEISFYRRVASQSYNENEGINLNDYQLGTPDIKYLNAKDNPVFEILRIPFPSIANIDYEVILWTNYITQQNIQLETMFQEFQGGRTFILSNGYSIFTQLKNTSDESNIEDFTNKERILKTKFLLSTTMYFIDKKKVKISRTLSNMKITMKEEIA